MVERSVKMEAQTQDDRNNGRIRFRADQPGLVYLGYQINGVTSPGSLNNVPGNCRRGRHRASTSPVAAAGVAAGGERRPR